MEIILVEDSPHDAELAQIAIRRAGYGGALTRLVDGEAAIDWLHRREVHAGSPASPLPRLVLLDLNLPRFDGLEVLRQMKASPRMRRMPVVIFTSSREERDIARAFECGANAYVVKPVDFGAYCEVLAQVIAFWTRLSEEPSYAPVG